MFEVIIPACSVHIEGCPTAGIAAVDFRRQHNLPEAPTSRVDLPKGVFVDEASVRDLAIVTDYMADASLGRVCQKQWSCNARGSVYEDSTAGFHYTKSLQISPEAIRSYLARQTLETAVDLILDAISGSERSKLHAEQEAAVYQQQQQEKVAAAAALEEAKLKARELLKDELYELQEQIVKLQDQLHDLRVDTEQDEEEEDDE